MSIKEMTKDDWELLSNKDITNLLLTENGATNTADLYKKIIKLLELPSSTFDAKIGDYYTSLTTDKRFILLEDGAWDLKKRHSSDKIIMVEDDDDDELEDFKDEEEVEPEEEAEAFDKTVEDEDEFDDDEDDLKDLVVLDEDELELEQ